MMSWRIKFVLIGLLLISPFSSFPQSIQNFSYKIIGTNIELIYDLTGEINDKFYISLYSSLDEFNLPLRQVAGDVGKGIKTGINNRIIWSAKEELGNFKGHISLKLKSSLIPPTVFTNPVSGTRFRRGKTYELTLTGREGGENMKFELYKGSAKVKDLTLSAMNSNYTWEIADDLKPGKDYKIKTTVEGKMIFSSNFQIAPKIPLILKAVPFFLVGGVVAILSGVSSSESSTNNDIDDPFLPE